MNSASSKHFLCVLILSSCASQPPSDPLVPIRVDFEVIVPDIHAPDVVVAEEVLFDEGPCAGLYDGDPCDDEDLCTFGDTCVGGFCLPGEKTVCPAGEDPCQEAVCLPNEGCTTVALPDESACALPCFANGICQSGSCIADPATEKICPPSEDPCIESIRCDPTDGTCSVPLYALSCPEGFSCHASDGALSCVESHPWLCRPCGSDNDCLNPLNGTQLNLCVSYGGEGSFCGSDCTDLPCPTGYSCEQVLDSSGQERAQCVADSGECACRPEWASLGFETTCYQANMWGSCSGNRYCLPGGLTPCSAGFPTEEVCDGIDNDCDGQTDIPDGCGAPGACCVGLAQCTESYKTSCALQGGTYQGVGVDCSGAACGGATEGACCRPDGTCAMHTLSVCLSLNGQYLGDGQDCDGLECTAPPGVSACCRPNGSCSLTTSVNCTLTGGVYQGAGLICGDVACPVLGSCCLPDTTCLDVSQAECGAFSGDFSANGVCADTNCLLPPGVGACCLDGGSCAVMPEAECSAQFLEGENCVGQCSSPSLGACCAPLQQGCVEVQLSACPPGHLWEGVGSVCADSCIEETGICCNFGNCYPGLTEPQCNEVGGIYAGPDATCDACD